MRARSIMGTTQPSSSAAGERRVTDLQIPLEALVQHFSAAFSNFFERQPVPEQAALERPLDDACARLEKDFATALWHVRQNLLLRLAFCRQSSGLLSATEAAALLGIASEQAPSILERRECDLQLFSVLLGESRRYPRFQFDSAGRVPAALPVVLERLAPLYRGWELAVWWISANAFLDGQAPIDFWSSEPETVSRAAAQEREASGDVL